MMSSKKIIADSDYWQQIAERCYILFLCDCKGKREIAPPRTANTYPYSLGKVRAVIRLGFALSYLTEMISKYQLSDSVSKCEISWNLFLEVHCTQFLSI